MAARHRRAARPASRRRLAGVIVVAALVVVDLVLLVALHGSSRSGGVRAGSPRSLTAQAEQVGAASPGGDALGVSSTPQEASSHSRSGHWLRVLAAIDARRAAAWRTGRPGRLSSVYVPGSAALRRDRAMLSAYLRRGLTVRHVALAFRSVVARRLASGSVSLEVVDRLRPAVAVSEVGARRALPRDGPSRHRIRLRRVAGQWRIATVTLT